MYLIYKGTGECYVTEELYAIADSLEQARRFVKQIENDTAFNSSFGWAIDECGINKLIDSSERIVEQSKDRGY